MEFLPIVRTEQKGIAHTFFPQFADQYRFTAVQRLPVATIFAQDKINLLSHRRGLAIEGHKQETAIGGKGSRTGVHSQEKNELF
jgi:hypothetical protein